MKKVKGAKKGNGNGKQAKSTIFDIDLAKQSSEELRRLRHQFYARRTHASDETRKLCNARIKQLHDILVERKAEAKAEKAKAKTAEKKAAKKPATKKAKKETPAEAPAAPAVAQKRK